MVFFVTFIFLLIIPISGEEQRILYVEQIDAYANIDGEIYRWDSEREFAYYGHSLEKDENGTTMAKLRMEDDGNYGQVKELVVDYKAANFDLQAEYLPNGSLSEITWEIIMIRDFKDGSDGGEPFDKFMYDTVFKNGGRRYDIKSNATYFSVNLLYSEYINVTGSGLKEVKTSTELGTNNEADGTIIRSTIHIIKRDENSKILYDFNKSVQMVSTIRSVFNIFDQPFLWVPIRYLFVFLLIILYRRMNNYLKTHKITISKIEEPVEAVDEND